MDDQKEPTSEGTQGQLPMGAANGESKGAGNDKVTEGAKAPEPRTYSVEEWDKRQSSWDTKVSEADKTQREALQAIEDRVDEEKYRSILAQVEEAGGNVGEAKQRIVTEKELKTQRRGLDVREAAATVEKTRIDGALKVVSANELAEKYSLSKDDHTKLLEMQDPQSMENKALKLALEKSKVGQTPKDKTDSGPSSGVGADISKMSPDEKIRFGLENPGQ